MRNRRWIALLIAALLACTAAGCATDAGGDDNVLTVAMECSYAPYNWTQPDESNGAVPIRDSADYAYGYDVMMAKYLAEQMGMELEIVRLDWDSLVMAVQSGTVDCAIAGQSITAKRLEQVDFTTPYYYASIVSLVMADGPYADAAGISDLAGATCTSQQTTVWYDTCLPQIENADILPAIGIRAGDARRARLRPVRPGRDRHAPRPWPPAWPIRT